MDHRRPETFYVIVSPGLEEICAAELADRGLRPQAVERGGVTFTGRLRDLYLANLWLRTASRILVRFAAFQSRDFPDLYRKALRLPWGRFIKPDRPVALRVTSHGSRLNHSGRITKTLESALNQALGRPSTPAGGDFAQLVLARIADDRVTLSIDSSGERLHRRGYRQAVTIAPLRETLAAGVLLLLGWTGDEPLADPMCGSGSFLSEGAALARHRPPGLDRTFAFMDWPGYRAGLWTQLRQEAARQEVDCRVAISGADGNPDAVAAANRNCLEGGHAGLVTIEQRALAEQTVHDGQGLVVCNPPYGKRLALEGDPQHFYREIGDQLRRAYPGWRVAMLCPDAKLVRATGLPFKRIAQLDNGGLSVGLFATRPGV